ncbi:hypothetical protein TELCIR_16267 [Teladorsagia circumcincta]|uniref:2-amino-3-carboxymuconate-6-semialdehyde decarboxylase n=1 Tax=Teladorsagia circumcincta TaxID=45464 RepID=A0A2G9TW95_TELCI|nr:hypothetical protein TELCIR_16267 [Teladorsagia circumcincta]
MVCEELDMVLFVHPWDMHNWDGRLTKYWMPWLVGIYYSDQFFPFRVLNPNADLELSSVKCHEADFIWTAQTQYHLEDWLDKIVLGTDYPFPLGELEVGKVVEDYDGFSDSDKNQLLWGNAMRMLRLDENSLCTQLP